MLSKYICVPRLCSAGSKVFLLSSAGIMVYEVHRWSTAGTVVHTRDVKKEVVPLVLCWYSSVLLWCSAGTTLFLLLCFSGIVVFPHGEFPPAGTLLVQ